MDKKEEQIIEEVRKLEDEIVDLTVALTAEPSTLGNEQSVLRVMEEKMDSLGLDPVQVPINPEELSGHDGFAPVPWDYDGRYNLAAIHKADGTGGKSALFNGHLDVVSPEPVSLWDRDPFEPVVEDGHIYGRGAGDMKAGVAAMTFALKAVENASFGLNADATIQAVIEEECTGNGAFACAEAGYNADGVVITEPFDRSILLGQVGVIWFRVRIFGVPRHVSEATAGVNAIEKCFPIITELRELEMEMNEVIHPAFEMFPHPLNLNIGIIKGGDWPSTVPAEAEFNGRLSFFPGTPYKDVQEKVRKAVERSAEKDPWLKENMPEVKFYAFRSDGHYIEEELPLFTTLNDCHKSLNGVDVIRATSTATTDVRVFHHFGKTQATCYGPKAYNIHAANEKVEIKSIVETAETLALFLARWCGLKE